MAVGKKLFLGILMVCSLVLDGCASAGGLPTANQNQNTVTATVYVIPIPTDMPPTSTPTAQVTTTPVSTPTPAITATASPVQIIPKGNVNCRKYPMLDSPALGYLVNGKSAIALGKDPSGEWYQIVNPSKADKPNCWIWSGGVDVNGDPSSLSILPAVIGQ
jgi:hypothetical protein